MILDGKSLRDQIFADLKPQIQDLKLSLAVIQIGSLEASNVFIKQKAKMCEQLNITFKHYQLDENVSEREVINLIKKLNQDETTGILLQMPIPKHYNLSLLQNIIAKEKDIDGLSIANLGHLFSINNALKPGTAKGIVEMLKSYDIPLAGRHAVIVGRSSLVGKPLAHLLLNEDATVTICHSKTINLADITKQADILILAAGKKHLITAEMVKSSATLIDVGINKEDGKLYGDVDFNAVKDQVKAISPVPGGVGPMTIAMLAQNLYEAYLLQNKTS